MRIGSFRCMTFDDFLQSVPTTSLLTRVGIGKALCQATSFGSGPRLKDKILLPSLQSQDVPTPATKPIAPFSLHEFADSEHKYLVQSLGGTL